MEKRRKIEDKPVQIYKKSCQTKAAVPNLASSRTFPGHAHKAFEELHNKSTHKTESTSM